MPVICKQQREIKYSESDLVELFKSVTNQEFGCLISPQCLYDHIAERNGNKLQQDDINYILKLFEHNKDILGNYCLKKWPDKYYEPILSKISEILISKNIFKDDSNWGHAVRTKFSVCNRYCKIKFTSCKKYELNGDSTSSIIILAQCLFPTCNLKFSLVCKNNLESDCDNELTFKVRTSGSCIHLKKEDAVDSMKLIDKNSPIKSSYSPYQKVDIETQIGFTPTKDIEDDTVGSNYRINNDKKKSQIVKENYKDKNGDTCIDQNKVKSSKAITQSTNVKKPTKHKEFKSESKSLSNKSFLSDELQEENVKVTNCNSVNVALKNSTLNNGKIHENCSPSFVKPKKKQRRSNRCLPQHALLVSCFDTQSFQINNL